MRATFLAVLLAVFTVPDLASAQSPEAAPTNISGQEAGRPTLVQGARLENQESFLDFSSISLGTFMGGFSSSSQEDRENYGSSYLQAIGRVDGVSIVPNQVHSQVGARVNLEGVRFWDQGYLGQSGKIALGLDAAVFDASNGYGKADWLAVVTPFFAYIGERGHTRNGQSRYSSKQEAVTFGLEAQLEYYPRIFLADGYYDSNQTLIQPTLFPSIQLWYKGEEDIWHRNRSTLTEQGIGDRPTDRSRHDLRLTTYVFGYAYEIFGHSGNYMFGPEIGNVWTQAHGGFNSERQGAQMHATYFGGAVVVEICPGLVLYGNVRYRREWKTHRDGSEVGLTLEWVNPL